MSKGEKVLYDINDCLEHTCQLNKSRLKNEAVQIISVIENIKIHNYKNELTQVFMNIFNNAFDVLNDVNKNSRYICIKIYLENDNAIIKIIDSGKGANIKILDRIFDPYFTTKNQKLGTGIGLYMCKEIIQMHMGGTITAQNNTFEHQDEIYSGLEFIISLPIETIDD